uniref:Uncharacterized protein n=1 Tax=Anguilla anguilla TaxID=7936 RepID=A0A0E9QRA7_ANGAN
MSIICMTHYFTVLSCIIEHKHLI